MPVSDGWAGQHLNLFPGPQPHLALAPQPPSHGRTDFGVGFFPSYPIPRLPPAPTLPYPLGPCCLCPPHACPFPLLLIPLLPFPFIIITTQLPPPQLHDATPPHSGPYCGCSPVLPPPHLLLSHMPSLVPGLPQTSPALPSPSQTDKTGTGRQANLF